MSVGLLSESRDLAFQMPSLSEDILDRVAGKIWQRESSGRIEGLTFWNPKEEFPSLGIGHFIWYPQGKEGPFQQTFPDLIQFFQRKNIALPEWLKEAQGAPWSSCEEFNADMDNDRLKGLRTLFMQTKSVQAEFIIKRFEDSFPQIIESLRQEEKTPIIEIALRLAGDAKGLYALIDYLHFKGLGTSSKETYEGKGWGLLQVLQAIPTNALFPLENFVIAAKSVLSGRVSRAPPAGQEARYLQGWFNRINSYLND